MPTQVAQYEVAEIALGSASATDDSAAVDVIFTDPAGRQRRVPAFITDGEWRVRYSAELEGTHSYHTEGDGEVSLPAPNGVLDVVSHRASRGLRSHGPLRVADDQRHLEHLDGTPFLWLADTWWHGFVQRLSNEEFRDLAAKRAEQGFSVVQIVAGLYPEMEPFAPEGRSNSGWVWHQNFTAPNLAWFDEADHRIRALVERDLVPCIVGSWAYYLMHMDTAQMLRHWREMIARWSAYPVVWCLAGEPPGPWSDNEELRKMLEAHISEWADVRRFRPIANIVGNEVPVASTGELHNLINSRIEQHLSEMLKRLNEVARGARELDPFGRPVTIHSQAGGHPWLPLEDDNLVDFWLQQTGHGPRGILAHSVRAMNATLTHLPTKPAINGEACYEGISGAYWQDTQRFLFWSHLLSGAAGHTYGAHGVWAFNTPQFPGFYSGRAPYWKDAAEFLGAAHVGIGRKILAALPWQEFRPHPEWVTPHQSPEDLYLPYAAGIEGGVRLIYLPSTSLASQLISDEIRLQALGERRWRARPIDPRTGYPEPEFLIDPEPDGTAVVQRGGVDAPLPSPEDWLLLLTLEP